MTPDDQRETIGWTDAATAAFEHHFDARATALRAAGADPDEVREDLRAHLEEELRGRGQALISIEDVEDFLRRRGLADPVDANAAIANQASGARNPGAGNTDEPPVGVKPLRHFEHFFHLACGVLLPLLAVILEATMHITADVAFNPIPTIWHIALVAFVPLANLAAWNALRTGVTISPRLLGWTSGAAVTISGLYCLMYLPLIPVSVIGALFLGIGLLGLTPHTAFASALRLRLLLSRRERIATGRGLPGLLGGALAVLALLTVFHAPATVTRIGLVMATSESPSTRLSGIRWLRRVGSEEELLRACYFRTGAMQDPAGFLLSFGDPVLPHAARGVFYRVTGRSFNAMPRPKEFGSYGRDDFAWDNDIGGTTVGESARGLTLEASRLDASLDAEAGIGYFEWTMEFKNENRAQAEARCEVKLPPGGVVSRLTLWIDGEEREAAFAGRGEVRAAYQSVVQRRRDPVLVTTRGRDRVLVQCFPVPPGGGAMKIRLGVTTPLAIDPAHRDVASLILPKITERNFAIRDAHRHLTWIAARSGFRELPDGLAPSGASDARGEIPDAALGRGLVVRLPRDAAVTRAWSESRETGLQILGEWRDLADSPLARLVVVVDGSASMTEAAPAIAEWLEALPESLELALLIADDASYELSRRDEAIRRGTGRELAAILKANNFVGGIGNLPALSEAWDNAAAAPGGAVLWIHGPQPEPLANAMALAQRADRAEKGPRLFAITAVEGPNHILRDLTENPLLVSHDDGADLAERLASWRARHIEARPMPRLLTSRAGAFFPIGDARRTSDHLVRLWAAQEVERLLAVGKPEARAEAVKLAAHHQIVTAVTGAVVLETQAQYDAAGLTPVDPASVPTIPEPATIILIAIVLLALALMQFLSRRRWA
jgi:hypothetical protein